MERRRRTRVEENEEGTVLFSLDPIIIKDHYKIDYVHSYAQDSPFFAGLAEGELRGSRCDACSYTFATPRGHCMNCGKPTRWVTLPTRGTVHTFTTCYYASEAFLKEVPYTLVMVEFTGVDTLFMSRLVGVDPAKVRVGMEIEARFLRNSKFRVTDVYFVPLLAD